MPAWRAARRREEAAAFLPRRRAALLSAAVPAAAVLLGASPAGAHEVHLSPTGQPWAHAGAPLLLGALLLVATVVLAGLLVVGLLAGPGPGKRVARAGGWLASVAAACDVAVLAAPAGLEGVLGGWPRWLAAVHVVLVLAAVPLLAGTRRRRWATVALSAALGVTLGAAGHPSRSGWGRVLEAGVGAVHVGAAAVWVGAVVHLALGWRRGPEGRAWLSAATRRLAPAATVAAVATVVTGLWNMAIHEAWTSDLGESVYGRVLLAKAALFVPAAISAGVLLRRWAQPARDRLLSLGKLVAAEAGAFVVVLSLASALVILPSPAAAREPGVALLRPLRLGQRWVTLSVAPQRPGPNIVQVLDTGAGGVSVRLDDTDLALEPDGNGGRWAMVQLPAGRSILRLRAGAATKQVVLDTARARRGGIELGGALAVGGPDRAECASRHLGRQVAVAEASASGRQRYRLLTSLRRTASDEGGGGSSAAPDGCATDPAGRSAAAVAIEPTPARAATGIVRFLAAQGVGRLLVVGDGSRRAGEFSGRAQAAAAAAGIVVQVVGTDLADAPSPPPDAAVVATGWAEAGRTLGHLTHGSGPTRGIYLAPWLLKPDLLEAALRPDAVQVSVGASLAPTSTPASAYLAALGRFAPGAVPTGPGMAGYLEARRAAATTEQRRRDLERLFSTAPASTADAGDMRRATPAAPASPSDRIELFTPVRLGFLPDELGLGHAHEGEPAAWIPGVRLASIGKAPSTGS